MGTDAENNPGTVPDSQARRDQDGAPAWVQLVCLLMLLFFLPAAFMMLRGAWKRREAATSAPMPARPQPHSQGSR